MATETAIHQRRVSIPSVAVADFARQIFERFDDKETLVIGAGEMAEETLRYLRDEGAQNITVINRNFERACQLAAEWNGRARPWEDLHAALTAADLVISTTGAGRAIVTAEEFKSIHAARRQRPLFVLDLAVPRDFQPAVGDSPEVYLYSVDDLAGGMSDQSPAARPRDTGRAAHHRAGNPPLHGRDVSPRDGARDPAASQRLGEAQAR